MPDINGIPYVESTDLVSGWPTISQSVAQEVSDQLASKLPYSFGTATPSTTDSGFLWYDSNSTPAAPKFWDGAAFQALTSGKILQIVRATDSTERTTTSTSLVDVTGMSVTITPTKSDSAILIVASYLARSVSSSGDTTESDFQIADSSNNPVSGAERQILNHNATRSAATGLTAGGPHMIWAYATPATTSAVTYKMRFRAVYATVTTYVRNNLNTGQMYALEIGS